MDQAQETEKMEVLPPASSALVERAKADSLRFMNPERWKMMNIMAQTFIGSQALPNTIKNAPQLIMVMQAGYEAGMQPLEALSAFYFVNGRLSIFGEAAIAQVMKAGHTVIWGECNAETATVTIKRKDGTSELTSTFTMAMAKTRGLAGKEPYQKFPENMLKFKAFHMTAKFVCPEALRGVEVKEVHETEFIEAKVVDPAKPEEAEKKAAEAAKDLGVQTRPLEEALKDKPEEKPAKAAKKKAEEPKADPEVGEAESPDQRAKRLIDEELKGRKLDADEMAFLREHEAKKAEVDGRKPTR